MGNICLTPTPDEGIERNAARKGDVSVEIKFVEAWKDGFERGRAGCRAQFGGAAGVRRSVGADAPVAPGLRRGPHRQFTQVGNLVWRQRTVVDAKGGARAAYVGKEQRIAVLCKQAIDRRRRQIDPPGDGGGRNAVARQ